MIKVLQSKLSLLWFWLAESCFMFDSSPSPTWRVNQPNTQPASHDVVQTQEKVKKKKCNNTLLDIIVRLQISEGSSCVSEVRSCKGLFP